MRLPSIIFSRVLLIATGCPKSPPQTALPPPSKPLPVAPGPLPLPNTLPSPPPISPAPIPAPAPPNVVNPLEQADNAFNAGNYANAAKGYEAYLQRQSNVDRRDQALFRLALTYAMSTNPAPDLVGMTTLLKQLVDQYPQSPLKGQAMVILSIVTDTQKRDLRIKQLNTELEKLKQIDADRRRRP